MSAANNSLFSDSSEQERRKRMSCALQIDCPGNIQSCLQDATFDGYHFIVTYIVHPKFARNLLGPNPPKAISRTDRVLSGTDWNRLIVGMFLLLV